jgi:hypothetical protein
MECTPPWSVPQCESPLGPISPINPVCAFRSTEIKLTASSLRLARPTRLGTAGTRSTVVAPPRTRARVGRHEMYNERYQGAERGTLYHADV